MRLNHFTLIFILSLLFSFSGNLMAQEDASIDASQVKYWIGEGVNEAIFIVNWNNPDTALAWGYRFNEETIMVKDMMEDIASTDSRFTFTVSGIMVNDLMFDDGVLNLSLAGQWWLFNVNGIMAMNYYDAQPVVNGDYVKWGDESCATEVPVGSWNYIWTKEVAPVYPIASDATIDPNDIHMWIGEGTNEVVFIVNWNNPNKAFAWGYRFNEETVVVKEVMDAISAADSRFDYQAAGTMVTDLTYNDGFYDLSLSGLYWLLNVNGSMAWYGYEEQTVSDGDYIKWGDESCATEVAQWTYVWEQTVEAVTDNTYINERTPLFIAVYPNPAADEAWIELEECGNTMVSIYDMQGRLVNIQNVNAMEETKVRLETAMMNSGVYFVTVQNNQISEMIKLIIK